MNDFSLRQYRRSNLLPNGIERRKSLVNRLLSASFSPASAFVLSMVGYYVFVLISGSASDDSQALSIYIRIFIFIVVLMSCFRFVPRSSSRLDSFLLPGCIFLLIYTLRLAENIFISDVIVGGGAAVVIGMFWAGGVIPSYIIAKRYRGITEQEFIKVMIFLFILLVIGLFVNRDMLVESSSTRMSLEKVNPISLGHLCFSFLIFMSISFRRSFLVKVISIFGGPILALVVVYARSRGPYLAGFGALLLYVLLLKGTRRVWFIAGFALAAIIVGYVVNPDVADVVSTQLSRTDLNSDMSNQMRVIAFSGAWNQFLDHFIVGRYVVELQTGYYPHNIYLESLMSVGILGSLPFLLHIWLTCCAAVGIIRDRNATVWATFAAVMFFREAFAGFVSGSVWGATGFWIASFVTIAVWYGGYPNTQRRLWSRHLA